MTRITCSYCSGNGEIAPHILDDQPCPMCDGKGYKERAESSSPKPAGTVCGINGCYEPVLWESRFCRTHQDVRTDFGEMNGGGNPAAQELQIQAGERSQEPSAPKELARNQPCGCVVCICEDDVQCQGCGAKNCGTHVPGKMPNPVYAAEQPSPAAPSLQEFWNAQSEWSQSTFGTDAERGPIGPLKHLQKEAGEAQEHPEDIFEFADCLFLVFDATRRAGFTLDQLQDACWRKLAINKERHYPKANDMNAAVEHDRSKERR